MKTSIAILITSLGCLAWFSAGGQPKIPAIPPGTNQSRVDVVKRYTPSGWMGDGTNGTKYVQINKVCKSNTRPNRQTCIKITYSIGPSKWAGIYWLNEPDNWGDNPGDDFSSKGLRRVSFWARGERGGEVVEFKAGGIPTMPATGKPYRDSFKETTGELTLERNWKHYDINIEGRNLSSVIGLFCWVANEPSNPNGLTFYLDDICYE